MHNRPISLTKQWIFATNFSVFQEKSSLRVELFELTIRWDRHYQVGLGTDDI